MHRMALIRSILAAAALWHALPALAQSYPARPVTMYIGLSAGGSVDLLARATAEELSTTLGQRFMVVNREGAHS